MIGAREVLPGTPGPARDRGLASGAANRALRRALSGAAASSTLGVAHATATRTLARCPGCGGTCGGTCDHPRTEPEQELMATGQRALRRAVQGPARAAQPEILKLTGPRAASTRMNCGHIIPDPHLGRSRISTRAV